MTWQQGLGGDLMTFHSLILCSNSYVVQHGMLLPALTNELSIDPLNTGSTALPFNTKLPHLEWTQNACKEQIVSTYMSYFLSLQWWKQHAYDHRPTASRWKQPGGEDRWLMRGLALCKWRRKPELWPALGGGQVVAVWKWGLHLDPPGIDRTCGMFLDPLLQRERSQCLCH